MIVAGVLFCQTTFSYNDYVQALSGDVSTQPEPIIYRQVRPFAGAGQAGAAEVADAVLCRIEPTDIVAGHFINEQVLRVADVADALAFGSPTYMDGPAAQFKAFADATSDRWTGQRWANKVACGFTTGSCANGDQGHTLAYFAILAGQHGMLWCGLDIPGGMDPGGRNRLGSGLGLATHVVDGTLGASDLATAHHLGRRVAITAVRTSL